MHLFPTIGEGIWALNITTSVMILLVGLIVIILAQLAVRKVDVRRPRGMQNFFEWIIDFVHGLAKDTIGEKEAIKFVPLAFTLIIFLFVSNQLGLIMNINTEISGPIFGVTEEQLAGHGDHASVAWFMSPTANLNAAIALAVAMVMLSHIVGLRKPGKYFKHYFEPSPPFVLIHLIDEGAKFLTLGLRLFGNIFAGEVLISILVGIPLVAGWIPVASVPLLVWLGYSLFVGTIQAFVFTVLTLVYIGQKMPHDEHH